MGSATLLTLSSQAYMGYSRVDGHRRRASVLERVDVCDPLVYEADRERRDPLDSR